MFIHSPISPDGTCAPVAVADANSNLIRQIILTTASVKTLGDTQQQGAGETVNGIGSNSRFNSPTGISISPAPSGLALHHSADKRHLQ
jgi:hypothetical protein